jgi:predicted HicB family RNase H-like nuclease
MMQAVDRYTYRVTWAKEDQEFVATCAEFPSLSWLDRSPEKALAGIRKVVVQCVEDMTRSNEPIPEPLSAKSFSDRFMVRVPPRLHRRLATLAAESGISLNRLVSPQAIPVRNGR